MPQANQAKLARAMTRRHFVAGSVIFWEDDPGEVVYVIDSGHVLVEHSAPDGTSIPFIILGAGEIIGEDGLVVTVDRLSTVRAVTEVNVLSLSRAAYTDLCSSWPGFDHLPALILAIRNRQLTDALLEARHRAPEERMRKQLQRLGRMFGDEIPLPLETIAGLSGTSEATTRGVFSALQGNGTIDILNGRVIIKTGAGLT